MIMLNYLIINMIILVY